MFNLALSEVLADRPENTSPVIVCRSGSTQTSFQTSINNVAVRSKILLWHNEGNPPFWQEMACSTEKTFREHISWKS